MERTERDLRRRLCPWRPRHQLSALLLLLSVAVTLTTACTGSPPEILQTEVHLEYVDNLDLEVTYEQLSAFVLVRDEDGFGDIRTLYLIHDQAELYWRLDSDSWTHRRSSGEDWVGFSGITMADWSAMPRGRYRLVVMDAAGEIDERAVSIDAPALEAVRNHMPRFDARSQRVTVPSGGALLLSFAEDNDVPVARERALSAGEYTVAELLGDPGSERAAPRSPVYLYVELGSHYGSLSGPFRP